MNGYGIGAGTGYNYNPGGRVEIQKRENPLTQEEIQRLMKKENMFSLQLTETEKLKACCNHMKQDGISDALSDAPDGRVFCNICQYTFKALDANFTDRQTIEEATESIIDILQTIKLIYINMPKDVMREYFQIIPLIEKIPKLFDYAVNNFAKYGAYNAYNYNDRNIGAMNLFNMLVGGGATQWNNQPPYPQPQAPIYSQQSNGFGFDRRVVDPNMYRPTTNDYAYDPNQQQNSSVGTPSTPPAVTETFKA